MEPLCISLVGLTRWDSVFVETTVNLASGIEIAPWQFVEDPYRADVLLVDADRSQHQLLNHKKGESTGETTPIVISFTADSTVDLPFEARGLTRPVKYAELIAVLKEIEHELHDSVTVHRVPVTDASAKSAQATRAQTPKAPPAATPVRPVKSPKVEKVPVAIPAQSVKSVEIEEAPPAKGTPKSDPRRPKEDSVGRTARAPTVNQPASRLLEKSRPARRFVEATRFIGLVKQVLRRGRPVEITHPGFPTVRIFPNVYKYSSTGEVTSLPDMFRESAIQFSTRELSDDTAAALLWTDQCRPIGPLVYSAALFGSEGRLVLNCSPDDKLHLIGWPDFDVVPHVEEHKQIARHMLTNDSSLLEIASSIGVRISTVIGFCNACEAAGLVRRTPAANNLRADAERDGAHRQVLQLLERIREIFKSP